MNKIIRFYDKDGFTIIELLMAILILGVVMAAITTMIVQSFNVFDSSTRRMSAGQLAELALSEVGGYLRAVSEINPNNIIEHDTTLVPEDDKIYEFQGYYNGESAKIRIEFASDQNNLLLTVNDVPERTVLNNIIGFYIDIDETTGEFDIFIEAKDNDDNIARKNLNISSRNL